MLTSPIAALFPALSPDCKHRVGKGAETLRRLGPHKTAAATVGAEIVGAEKPTFGRKSHIKEFYDQNHLSVISH